MIAAPRPSLVTVGLVAIAVAVASGCSIDRLDLSGKGCPCAAGWTCDITTSHCLETSLPPDAGLGCAIYSDGKLYCANTSPAAMYASPSISSGVVNTLGDDTTEWGWVPAADLETPDPFDADPGALGLRRCQS
jgi:hypothetical protein